jgi:hypothetical protein
MPIGPFSASIQCARRTMVIQENAPCRTRPNNVIQITIRGALWHIPALSPVTRLRI